VREKKAERRKQKEGRRKKEDGRRKTEEGRRKTEKEQAYLGGSRATRSPLAWSSQWLLVANPAASSLAPDVIEGRENDRSVGRAAQPFVETEHTKPDRLEVKDSTARSRCSTRVRSSWLSAGAALLSAAPCSSLRRARTCSRARRRCPVRGPVGCLAVLSCSPCAQLPYRSVAAPMLNVHKNGP
jgi:hypothetical protein